MPDFSWRWTLYDRAVRLAAGQRVWDAVARARRRIDLPEGFPELRALRLNEVLRCAESRTAAYLIRALDGMELPAAEAGTFPLPPKLTVTGVHGGEGFRAVPDTCGQRGCAADRCLGYRFRCEAAPTGRSRTRSRSSSTQADSGGAVMAWPPFLLGEHDQPAAALLASAREAGINARPKIAGPSNTGNLLGDFGIRATAGFGLRYRGLHGTDECGDLDALPAVHAAYHRCVRSLLDVGS